MKNVILTGLIILLSGCTTNNAANMRAWMGHHESEVVSQWGMPHAVRVQNGQRYLVWRKFQGYRTCEKVFQTDRYGYIRSWGNQGCIW